MRNPIFTHEVALTGLRQSSIEADDVPALAASGIHRVGRSLLTTPRIRPIDVARHRVLHITVSGEGKGFVNGRWLTLPAGTAYIVPPGAEWKWRYDAGATVPWEVLFVSLEPRLRFSSPAGTDTAYIRRSCDPTDLLWAFQQLYKESLAKGRATIMASLSDIIVCLAGEFLDEEEHHYQLSNLWVTVSSDLSRPWDVATLSREASMCKEKLRLLCHKETGRSPMAQVTYMRMRYAADLLTHDDWSVQEVGVLVGYRNPHNFSLAFKRLYGLSPRHFRKTTSAVRS